MPFGAIAHSRPASANVCQPSGPMSSTLFAPSALEWRQSSGSYHFSPNNWKGQETTECLMLPRSCVAAASASARAAVVASPPVMAVAEVAKVLLRRLRRVSMDPR